ncbi:MAG: riboflavin synthase [Actinobacteria bacterium]|nr:MAG: riboflavin synthase [Actinomycetota bacterium]
MFTGIVEELGAVLERSQDRITVSCRTVLGDTEVGSSIAVNGICLTVVDRGPSNLGFDLSEETIRRTGLARLSPGDPVNLERPVTLATRLGGHLVQGHVDGVGEVVGVEADPTGGAWLTIRPPAELLRYLVEKGSVSVDGVSLTVAGLDGDAFSVALIPHTLAATTLGTTRMGESVNLEVDVLAKYVERLLTSTGERART